MRNNVFSTSDPNTTRYVPNVKPTSFRAPIPFQIAPLRARSSVVSASQRTAALRNIGISNTTFDVNSLTDPKADLGVVYSNGFRLQYLEFKATGILNPNCLIHVQDSTQTQTIVNADNTISIVDVDVPAHEITTAYTGNAVVPPLPNENIQINTMRPPTKIPVVPSKINC